MYWIDEIIIAIRIDEAFLQPHARSIPFGSDLGIKLS